MDEDKRDGEPRPSYSRFACIGSGFSAIGLGATLKRWYGIDDVRFFEKHSELGGTWFANQYPGAHHSIPPRQGRHTHRLTQSPGAACDVPSALYSFSFECNPDWSCAFPPGAELWAYLKKVADKYDLPRRMTFDVTVERCEWIDDRSVWRLRIRDNNTGALSAHESQFLFAATGILVQPRELDVPGAATFKGPVIHSARWRHDVDLTGKRVVLFGNGCTAAQIVPNVAGRVAHLTQVIRTKHWVFPPPLSATTPNLLEGVKKYLPFGARVQRFLVFAGAEQSFRGFYMTEKAAQFRRAKRERVERYMRATAPEKYHHLLIPAFEIGCKRRIFDPGYLASLHAPNVTLTDEPVLEVVPEGVRTRTGVIEADVIVLANGFVTGNNFFPGVEIVGRGGETVEEHWHRVFHGGAGAYNSSAMSGFPNFFALLGPNSATGHTSAIIAAENSVNYALRIIKPILDGRASVAEVKLEAEREYVDRVQAALGRRVFASGCRSWYLGKTEHGRTWNSAMYPWTQAYYWWRSLFPVWRDWRFTVCAPDVPTGLPCRLACHALHC